MQFTIQYLLNGLTNLTENARCTFLLETKYIIQQGTAASERARSTS